MSTILVTGGAGFIGRHFTQHAINAGHRIRVLDNLSPQVHGIDAEPQLPGGVEFARGDVTVRTDWETALQGVECVVHLAAETGTGQSMYEIDRYYRVNVQGTALLFDVLANAPHQVSNVLLASSRSVYGEGAYICRGCENGTKRCFPLPRSREQLEAKDWALRCPDCGGVADPIPTRESDATSPASIYAASKLAQENLVRIACQSAGIAHSILRLQNVYGEGQSLTNPYTGVLSIFSTRIRQGLAVPVFEDGAETRDFVHADDVADAMLACIAAPSPLGATVNVGSGKPVAMLEIANMLCRRLDCTISPTVTGQYRIGDIRHNFADIGALKALTGFVPRISLDEGIDRFCAWVVGQPPAADHLDRANAELKSRRLMG